MGRFADFKTQTLSPTRRMEHSRDCVKYVIVTGGVLSGLGKGISTSSIGVLLKSKGLKVCPVKIDPYLNVDAGTMNPYQHGEVFVLDDGSEVDLDLGNSPRKSGKKTSCSCTRHWCRSWAPSVSRRRSPPNRASVSSVRWGSNPM